MLNVKIKKLHENAQIPCYAKNGDAGLDLIALEDPKIELDGRGFILTYRTGLAFEIPEGHVGLIFPRSSIGKKSLSLTNSVGVIDSGYRGEVIAIYRDSANGFKKNLQYKAGEKIAQMVIMPYPQVELELVEELTTTERGEGSFGSSGA